MVRTFERLGDETLDEISVSQIVLSLWDGKWIVIGFTFVFALLGVAFALLAPRELTAKLDINPISLADFGAYRPLNTVTFDMQPPKDLPTEEQVTANVFFPIDREELVERFAEELNSHTSFVAEIDRLGILKNEKYASDADYQAALVQEAYRYRLTPPDRSVGGTPQQQANRRPNWSLAYVGFQTSDAVRLVLANAMAASTETTRLELVEDFQRAVAVRKRDNDIGIGDYEQKIANTTADYDLYVKNRIAGLKESAQIARALGVEKNAIEVQNLAAGNSLVSSAQADNPYYMRGYTAIEEEIRLISSRESNQAFIDGLAALRSGKRAIEQDNLIARATAAFDSTPIVAGNFKASSYDVGGVDMKPSGVRSLAVLALSIVLGGLVGTGFLTVRNILRSRARAANGNAIG